MSSSIPVVETDRLVLREFRASDFDTYAEMHAHPEVMQFLNKGKPLSREDAWRNLATAIGHWTLRGFGMWAVELRETGEFIGRIGLWYPEGWPAIEVGWSLNRPHWGKGYATEAANASVEYAFTTLGLDDIISLISPGNTGSIRVAERLGETFRERRVVRESEALVYGMTLDEWRSKRDAG